MTNQKIKPSKKRYVSRALLAGCLAVAGVLFGVIAIGSINRNESSKSGVISGIFDSNASEQEMVDKLSASYMSAVFASSSFPNTLPSVAHVANNFVDISIRYSDATINNSSILNSGVNIQDISNVTRGVVRYTLEEGDSLDAIARRHGITVDQIRWSNGMKNANIEVGKEILVPSRPGIVYIVKDGDTIEHLANKYGSNAAKIISANDLEVKPLAIDMAIIIPDGVVPERERPEYVAPRQMYYSSPITSRTGNVGIRENPREIANSGHWSYIFNNVSNRNIDGNSMTRGNCTWFAWYYRRHMFPNNPEYWLPTGMQGHANAWVRVLGGSYIVRGTPVAGDIFQTSGGSWWGHVGIVTAVHEDGSITVREMNFHALGSGYNRVIESEISASNVGAFTYIGPHR